MREALRTILVLQAGLLFSYEEKILADPDPEAVHDMRVAARRLRAVLRIFRKAFDREELKAHVATLSGLLRGLGTVRDRDVIIRNLDSLRRLSTNDSQASIDGLIRRQQELREGHSASLKEAVRAMRNGNARGSLLKFVRSSVPGTADLRRSLRESASDLLPALLGETTSYRREVLAHPERDETLHEMRIGARPLRYLMEAFEPAFGKPFSKRLKELKGFLDAAGEVHDCDVMIEMLTGQMGAVRGASGDAARVADLVHDVKIARLLATQRAARRRKFREFRRRFGALDTGKFRKKLLRSIR